MILVPYLVSEIYIQYLHVAGYSVVRSLSEAPNYAAVIANILKNGQINRMINHGRYTENISMQGT